MHLIDNTSPGCIVKALLAMLLASTAFAAGKPNVLIILADDLGFSDLGCYGGEISTPNLDALAANGLRFRQFYNGTRCCPTRASLLTGLYAHQAGVGNMTGDDKLPGYRGWPQPNAVMIPAVMKSAGYHTSMVGKWHLGGPKKPSPIDRGFDEYFGMLGGFNTCFDEHPHYTRLPADRKRRDYAKGSFYSTDAFADYSLEFLAEARKQGKPFFQYLAFNAPHFPLHALPEDIEKYKDTYAIGWDAIREARLKKQKDLGLFTKTLELTPRSDWRTRRDFFKQGENPAWSTLDKDRQADLARRMAVYAAMVDRMDQAIGKVIDDLKKHQQFENTLILFLSDNGACAEWDPFGFDESSGPKNILHTGEALLKMGRPGTYHSYGSGWANAGGTPFRLYKHYCHEGGIRTPCIAHWPAGIKDSGQYRDQVGHIIDIMATCVDLGAASYPKEINGTAITPAEGTSLRTAFQNRHTEPTLFWEHEGNKAIRRGDWKLVAKANSAWELYDLAKDPTEMNDLAKQEPKRTTELADIWESWAKRVQVFPKTK